MSQVRRVIACTAAIGAMTTASVAFSQTAPVPGANENQQQMAAAVKTVCPALATLVRAGTATADQTQLFVTCNRVLQATPDAIASGQQDTALQQLTAEEGSAGTRNSVTVGTLHRSSIASRLLALRSAGAGTAVASLAAPGSSALNAVGGASGDSGSTIQDGRLGVYAQGYLGSGNKDRTNFEDAYDIGTDGFIAGADYRFTEGLVAGVAIGIGRSDSDFTKDSYGDSIGGHFDSDSVTGSLYGSWYGDHYYVDVIGSYGSVDYDSVRDINYTINSNALPPVGGVPLPTTQTVDQRATGKTSGDTTALGIGAGYDFGNGPWRFGPLAALSYMKANVDGFTEKNTVPLSSNGYAVNLKFGDQEAESLQLQLGLDAAYTVSLSHGVLIPYGNFVWVSEQKDNADAFRLRYASDPCTSTATSDGCSNFDVTGDTPDTSFFNWNVGVSALMANGFSAFLNYGAVAALDTISYGEFTLGVRYQLR